MEKKVIVSKFRVLTWRSQALTAKACSRMLSKATKHHKSAIPCFGMIRCTLKSNKNTQSLLRFMTAIIQSIRMTMFVCSGSQCPPKNFGSCPLKNNSISLMTASNLWANFPSVLKPTIMWPEMKLWTMKTTWKSRQTSSTRSKLTKYKEL